MSVMRRGLAVCASRAVWRCAVADKTEAAAVRIPGNSGNRDYDHFQPQCSCGWRGALYSNRTIEGRRLAARDASQHRCRVEVAR